MASRTAFVTFSLVVHGALAVGIGAIKVNKSVAATAIEISEAAQKKRTPPPPPKAEPPPPKPEKRRSTPAAPTPAPAPEPAAQPDTQPLEALPDFGLSLEGGVSSGGGVALPAGPRTEAPVKSAVAPKVVKKALTSANVAPGGALGCDEPASKPRPKSVPQPAYTPEARAASVEGKVRVQLTVDETGRVINVKLIAGLGHGLDEAALAAARQATFDPALQCGKPVSATFNISMRFTL